jgi:acyl-CoA reductase-like NAD-dependent aldehyde dehydrogenase
VSLISSEPFGLLIGDGWVESATGDTRAAIDPANGEEILRFADASTADVDVAVAAARAALQSRAWADMTPDARGQLLWRLADLVEKNADEIALWETQDQGQPLAIAKGLSVPVAIAALRYYAGWTTKIEGKVGAISIPNALNYTRLEPVGVCALIIPWNLPFMTTLQKLAPALACGNTVVIKPSSQTSLSALFLGRLCIEAGFPPGVVNIVTGGAGVGAALAEHADVDLVSFTGSTEVGRSIVRAAAGNFKRVGLELGGKSPSIITADADIDAAVAGNAFAGLLNSGQVCVSYTRFFVHRSRAEEFTEKLGQAAAAMRLGAGVEATTDLGPLVSQSHLDSVDRYVQLGIAEGAQLVTGGSRAEGALENGFFYQPTVFSNVTDSMTIAREEIFGPVLSVFAYDDEDEVVARANSTEYGLAAAIWTRELSAAHRLAARVRAGLVFVNTPPIPDPAAPWGGYGASGWGREFGYDAISEFTETKSITLNLG